MKTAVSVSALAATAIAAAVPRQDSTNIDPTVLNFALTLEHLEDTFYSQALQKFTAADFKAAGAPDSFYTNLGYIASDEATHVKELTAALTAAGVTPVEACTYDFPYTDAKSFLGLSTILEGVGTSAYLGAAGLITSKAYLTAAGSILVSEALHTSLLRDTVGLVPNANPNGTPLDPMSVYSLAAPFFKSCPSSNPALPFTAFPSVTGPSAATKAGATVSLAAEKDVPAGSFLTFVSGLAVTSVSGTVSGKSISAAVPMTASGQTYVLITSTNQTALNDTTVVAGPAIIEVLPAALNGTSTGNSSTPASSSTATPSPYTGAASHLATSGLVASVIAAAAAFLL